MESNLTLKKMSFTNWFGRSASYELPERGLTLVTGLNGIGKSSSTVDAVCYAKYGKTYREEPPRDPGIKMNIRAEFYGGLVIERGEAGKASKTFAWSLNGDTHQADTRTKDALALATILPPIDNWKRTHVFSASDIVAFSTATDLSRKQLLEDMVGISHFDTCHRTFLDKKAEHEKAARSYAQQVAGLEARLLQVKQAMEQSKPAPTVDITELEQLAIAAHQKWKAADADVLIARNRRAVAEHEYRQAQRMTHTCPTCGQATGDKAQVEAAITKAKEQYELVNGAYELAARTCSPLAQEANTLQQQLVQARADVQTNERLRRVYDAAVKDHADIFAQLFEANLFADSETYYAQVYKHALDVVASARGKVFDDTLTSIQTLTNEYLDHLRKGMRVCVEVVPGRAGVDSVKLSVDRGDGVFRPYASLSNGQRRRVDVAMLLSLAQLSPSTGTLFFDEAFDLLDPPGLEAVCDLLMSFSKTRSIVVISPNPVFAQYLDIDHHLDIVE